MAPAEAAACMATAPPAPTPHPVPRARAPRCDSAHIDDDLLDLVGTPKQRPREGVAAAPRAAVAFGEKPGGDTKGAGAGAGAATNGNAVPAGDTVHNSAPCAGAEVGAGEGNAGGDHASAPPGELPPRAVRQSSIHSAKTSFLSVVTAATAAAAGGARSLRVAVGDDAEATTSATDALPWDGNADAFTMLSPTNPDLLLSVGSSVMRSPSHAGEVAPAIPMLPQSRSDVSAGSGCAVGQLRALRRQSGRAGTPSEASPEQSPIIRRLSGAGSAMLERENSAGSAAPAPHGGSAGGGGLHRKITIKDLHKMLLRKGSVAGGGQSPASLSPRVDALGVAGGGGGGASPLAAHPLADNDIKIDGYVTSALMRKLELARGAGMDEQERAKLATAKEKMAKQEAAVRRFREAVRGLNVRVQDLQKAAAAAAAGGGDGWISPRPSVGEATGFLGPSGTPFSLGFPSTADTEYLSAADADDSAMVSRDSSGEHGLAGLLTRESSLDDAPASGGSNLNPNHIDQLTSYIQRIRSAQHRLSTVGVLTGDQAAALQLMQQFEADMKGLELDDAERVVYRMWAYRDKAKAMTEEEREEAERVVKGVTAKTREREILAAAREALEREVDAQMREKLKAQAERRPQLRREESALQARLQELRQELAEQDGGGDAYGAEGEDDTLPQRPAAETQRELEEVDAQLRAVRDEAEKIAFTVEEERAHRGAVARRKQRELESQQRSESELRSRRRQEVRQMYTAAGRQAGGTDAAAASPLLASPLNPSFDTATGSGPSAAPLTHRRGMIQKKRALRQQLSQHWDAFERRWSRYRGWVERTADVAKECTAVVDALFTLDSNHVRAERIRGLRIHTEFKELERELGDEAARLAAAYTANRKRHDDEIAACELTACEKVDERAMRAAAEGLKHRRRSLNAAIPHALTAVTSFMQKGREAGAAGGGHDRQRHASATPAESPACTPRAGAGTVLPADRALRTWATNDLTTAATASQEECAALSVPAVTDLMTQVAVSTPAAAPSGDGGASGGTGHSTTKRVGSRSPYSGASSAGSYLSWRWDAHSDAPTTATTSPVLSGSSPQVTPLQAAALSLPSASRDFRRSSSPSSAETPGCDPQAAVSGDSTSAHSHVARVKRLTRGSGWSDSASSQAPSVLTLPASAHNVPASPRSAYGGSTSNAVDTPHERAVPAARAGGRSGSGSAGGAAGDAASSVNPVYLSSTHATTHWYGCGGAWEWVESTVRTSPTIVIASCSVSNLLGDTTPLHLLNDQVSAAVWKLQRVIAGLPKAVASGLPPIPAGPQPMPIHLAGGARFTTGLWHEPAAKASAIARALTLVGCVVISEWAWQAGVSLEALVAATQAPSVGAPVEGGADGEGREGDAEDGENQGPSERRSSAHHAAGLRPLNRSSIVSVSSSNDTAATAVSLAAPPNDTPSLSRTNTMPARRARLKPLDAAASRRGSLHVAPAGDVTATGTPLRRRASLPPPASPREVVDPKHARRGEVAAPAAAPAWMGRGRTPSAFEDAEPGGEGEQKGAAGNGEKGRRSRSTSRRLCLGSRSPSTEARTATAAPAAAGGGKARPEKQPTQRDAARARGGVSPSHSHRGGGPNNRRGRGAGRESPVEEPEPAVNDDVGFVSDDSVEVEGADGLTPSAAAAKAAKDRELAAASGDRVKTRGRQHKKNPKTQRPPPSDADSSMEGVSDITERGSPIGSLASPPSMLPTPDGAGTWGGDCGDSRGSLPSVTGSAVVAATPADPAAVSRERVASFAHGGPAHNTNANGEDEDDYENMALESLRQVSSLQRLIPVELPSPLLAPPSRSQERAEHPGSAQQTASGLSLAATTLLPCIDTVSTAAALPRTLRLSTERASLARSHSPTSAVPSIPPTVSHLSSSAGSLDVAAFQSPAATLDDPGSSGCWNATRTFSDPTGAAGAGGAASDAGSASTHALTPLLRSVGLVDTSGRVEADAARAVPAAMNPTTAEGGAASHTHDDAPPPPPPGEASPTARGAVPRKTSLDGHAGLRGDASSGAGAPQRKGAGVPLSARERERDRDPPSGSSTQRSATGADTDARRRLSAPDPLSFFAPGLERKGVGGGGGVHGVLKRAQSSVAAQLRERNRERERGGAKPKVRAKSFSGQRAPTSARDGGGDTSPPSPTPETALRRRYSIGKPMRRLGSLQQRQ